MSKIDLHDWVIFRNLKGKEWLRRVESGKTFQTHNGFINFDDIIGLSYGSIVSISKDKLLVLKPRPSQFIRTMKHATNVIYEYDAVSMISGAGIGPGNVILEIGTGSGGLTFYLAWYCTKNTINGKIVTIDLREKHINVARENLEKFNLHSKVEFRNGELNETLKETEFFEAAFIDMPTPWKTFPYVKRALKSGSSIMIFLPNWHQVEETIKHAKENDLTILDIFESNRRPMEVNPDKHIMRPVFRHITYSGILIHLIKSEVIEK